MAKMTKIKFLLLLNEKLSGLPQNEIEDRLGFYGEMIEDRIEEGMLEEDAVAAIGNVDEIADQIISELPLVKIAKEKVKPKRRLKAWEIVLLVLGCPVWLSLLIAAFAVIFSLYVSVWAVIVSLWAVFGAMVCCALGIIVAGGIFSFGGSSLSGIAMIGAGILCAGLAIFLFFGCQVCTKGTLLLTKKLVSQIQNCFTRKEAV